MPNPQPIKDGFTVLTGGMHGGLHPTLLNATQYAKGINLSIRGGYVRTRPGWVRLGARVTTNTPFQGAGRWSVNGVEWIVSCFTGSLFWTNLSTGATSRLDGQMKVGSQVFFAQADRYLVVSDGIQLSVLEMQENNVPRLVYTTILPDPTKLPPGTVMHYCHGRVHMVPTTVPGVTNSPATQNRYFVSGDYCLPYQPSTVYEFTEVSQVNGGGAVGLPDDLGAINGLCSFRNSAQGDGVGQLMVFAENGLAAFNVGAPRFATYASTGGNTPQFTLTSPGWNNIQFGQVVFYGAGTHSPWSIANVNNDLVYRGLDGIRFVSYSMTQAQGAVVSSNSLSNIPQSFEVSNWLDRDNDAALRNVSACFSNSRLHMTTATKDGRSFQGLVSLDSAIAQSFGSRTPAAYDGLWTGIPIGKVLSIPHEGRQALFAVGADGWIYRLDETSYQDFNSCPIESQMETRSFFSDPQVRPVQKQLEYVDLWLSGLYQDTTVTLYFRPDSHPLWYPLSVPRTLSVSGSYPQERRLLRFNVPPDLVTSTDRPGLNSASARSGQTFQVRLVIKGCAIIERMDVIANPRDPTLPEVSATEPASKVRPITPGPDGIATNDFSYTASS